MRSFVFFVTLELFQTLRCNCRGFGDPATDFCLQGKRAGNRGPKVCEVIHSLQHMPINGDHGGLVRALCHNFCLFQTDGQSELLAGVGETIDELLQEEAYWRSIEKKMQKSVDARTQPCFTPLLTGKTSEVAPLKCMAEAQALA